MPFKEKINSVCKFTVCVCGLFMSFYAVVELMLFLSDPNFKRKRGISKGDNWIIASWHLFTDTCLLSIFMLHHSLLALPEIKKFLTSIGLEVILRSLYVISTSLILELLILYWRDVPNFYLWNLNITSNLVWWLFAFVHIFAWSLIYVGSICMDISEMLGIKQVYYSVSHLPNPDSYKSPELKRLYTHMRHPSFIAFLVIFWVTPVMSLDRLLLATIFSTYMYLAWNTDRSDYRYQELQFKKKFR